MAEYIEREALYRKMADLEEIAMKRVLDTPSSSPAYARYVAQFDERTSLKHMVSDAPAADVAPVVHGHVVTKNRPTSYDTLHFIGTRENSEPIYTIVREQLGNNPVNYCSVCGRRLCSRFTNYCPNCGAKMQGEVNE